jgi:hypothetical protein
VTYIGTIIDAAEKLPKLKACPIKGGMISDPVLVYPAAGELGHNRDRWVVATFYCRQGRPGGWWGNGLGPFQATHWMALPPAPHG